MVKTILAAVIVVAVTVILSYYFLNFNFFGMNPRDLLESYKGKFDNVNNIRLTFVFKMPIMSTLIPISPEFQVDYYKLNNEQKSVVSIMGITSAVYIKDDIQITCAEGSIFGLTSTTGQKSISCKTSDDGNLFKPQVDESIFNRTNITYKGFKDVNGRTCDNFVIVMDASEIGELQQPMSLTGMATAMESEIPSTQEGRLLYEICLDKQYGYPTFLNASVEAYSALAGKTTTTNIFSLEVTHMSTDVKPEDMKIPVKFLINKIECEENLVKLNITALESFTGPTINLKLSSYSKNITLSKTIVSLDSGKIYSFDIIPTTTIDTGFYTGKVCIANDCQSDYCSVYSSYT